MSAPTSVHPPPSSSSPSAPEAPSSSRHVPAPNRAADAGPSSMANLPFLPPAFPSSSGSSRPPPSSPAPASRRLMTAAPTTTTAIATATATASAATSSTHLPGGGNSSSNTDPGQLPSSSSSSPPSRAAPGQQLPVAEARAALVATMSNMLDGELQSRAELLHANAGALSRQERDVERATAGLRRDNDKLARLVRDTEPRLKEIGNVQNWAEVLERDFLVLEETMRLVRRGSSDGETCSQCSSRSSTWSGSYSDDGSRSGSRVGSRRGSMNGDAKKDSPEQGVNGKTTTNGAVGDDMRKERNDTKVTVDEAVAASISEAMATNLHDALEPLTLDARPVPVSVPSSTQSAASKGKEPATEEMSDVDTTSAGASQPHSAAWSDTAEEQTTIGEDSKSASTAG